MSESGKAKFFPVTIEIFHKDKSVIVSGMASERGVTRIASEFVPDFLRESPGARVKVRLDSLVFQAIFCQQLNSQDSFYEVQFIDIPIESMKYLKDRIQVLGVEPFWQRKFPRIPVVGLSDPDLPVPNLCMIQLGSECIFANVINFTLGGIRIELMSESVREVKVGARFQFDLIATNGDVMNDLKGEIKNIEVREQVVGGSKSLIRSFGMKLINMDAINARKYRNLIKDYCVALKKKLNDSEP